MTKGEPILIEWYDAYSLDNWMKEEAAIAGVAEPMLCHTMGFFLSENEDCLSVCHTFNEDNQVCGVMQIPKRCMLGTPKQLTDKILSAAGDQ